jgi:hypothetical protein
MKNLFLATCLALGACGVSAQTEVKVWSQLVGAANYDFGVGAAVDPFGNVVIGGPTQSSLGGPSAGLFDVFAGKYDASGHKLWLAQRGTGDIEYGFDDLNGGVCSDPFGNVFVVGRTKGALDGNVNRGGYDYFVVKFSATGNWLWTRQDGSANDDAGRAVATDSAGNVFVTGYVRGDLHGVTRVGSADVFLVKYDPAGTRLWTAIFGSANVDESFGLTCDVDGNVIVTGWSDGSIEGNPYWGNGDNFLAKYDGNGQRLWLREWGTVNKDTGYALATDAARNLYLSGYTSGPLYGTPAGQRDVFLAKFDAGGTNLWGRQIGTPEHDQGWGVAADAAGNVFLAGQAGARLGSDPAAGGLDVLVAKYDTDGNQVWLRQLGSTNDDLARAIAMDTNGNVFVTGWSYGDFDGSTNAGLADVLLVKYAPANSPPPVPTALPAGDLGVSSFTARWYTSTAADGYRLDVSTNSAFGSFLAGYQDLDVGNVSARNVTGLSPGTTYYYRVRAYNAHGTSGHSATVAATTVIPVCTPVTLLNGDFEGATNANGVASGWTGYQRPPFPTTVYSIQNAGPPPGGGLHYQQIANTSSPGGGGVRQDVTGCTIGATYVVSGWMRGNSALATCRVKVSPAASTDWATAIDLNPPQVASTNNWVPFSGTVVATGTNMTVWLDGTTGGTGQNKAECFDSVTVTCLPIPVSVRFDSVSVPSPDAVQLQLSGTPGANVTVLRSSNLVDWEPVTNTVLPNGPLPVQDGPLAGAPQRFYRATSP